MHTFLVCERAVSAAAGFARRRLDTLVRRPPGNSAPLIFVSESVWPAADVPADGPVGLEKTLDDDPAQASSRSHHGAFQMTLPSLSLKPRTCEPSAATINTARSLPA